MNQRIALGIALGLTVFVLVIVGELVFSVVGSANDQSTPQALDPTARSVLATREAEYQQALAQANAEVVAANAALEQANTVTSAPAVATAPAAMPTSAPAEANLTVAQAQAVADAQANGSPLVQSPELVLYQGTQAYEFVFERGPVYVGAVDGTVLYNGLVVPTSASGPIDREQAIAIAQEYLGGGSVVEAEMETEHGRRVYSVKFTDGSEVYVDAASGRVVYAEAPETGEYGREHGDDEHWERDDEDHGDDEYDD
jgi:uncharacterized membrane protein YkoI